MKKLVLGLIFMGSLLSMPSCTSDKMTKEDFIGTWKIDDATAQSNDERVEPQRDELGTITLSEGSYVSYGQYGIASSGILDYLNGNAQTGSWECNIEHQQIKLNGILWNVRKINDNAMELTASQQRLGSGIDEYQCFLSRMN